jgi:quercetin dioxygenase-like cupin family protein
VALGEGTLLESGWLTYPASMKVSRLYSGPDGQTHIEWMTLETHPQLATPQGAKTIVFRSTEAGHFMDWHPAPRRQYVITVSGEVEIGLGDGSVHRFGPGHVTLAEDLTGKGHTTRVVGDQPRVTATIPIDVP